MTPEKDRYFIGIVPPSPVYDQALELKNYFKDTFKSKASLNSPPHITLHMPFEWKVAKESELIDSIQQLSSRLTPVEINLKDFDCFSPRVIFIKVAYSDALKVIQQRVHQFCKKELGIFNADYKDRPFHPHITIAFRDLKKPAFFQSWQEFKHKTFDAQFLANSMCLLKHDGKKWEVMRRFMLAGN